MKVLLNSAADAFEHSMFSADCVPLTTINNSEEQMRRLYKNPPFMLSSLTGYRQYHSCTTDINYFRILKRKVSQRFVLTEAWRSKHQLFSHSGKLNLWRQIFFVSLSHRRRASVSFQFFQLQVINIKTTVDSRYLMRTLATPNQNWFPLDFFIVILRSVTRTLYNSNLSGEALFSELYGKPDVVNR